MFHHDPAHADAQLDQLAAEAAAAWSGMGGQADQVAMAVEGSVLEL